MTSPAQPARANAQTEGALNAGPPDDPEQSGFALSMDWAISNTTRVLRAVNDSDPLAMAAVSTHDFSALKKIIEELAQFAPTIRLLEENWARICENDSFGPEGDVAVTATEQAHKRIRSFLFGLLAKIPNEAPDLAALLMRDQSTLHRPGQDGATALIVLAKTRPAALAAAAEHCEIDAQDARGMTALMWAAAVGQAECVKILLNLGANPALADEAQWTPLARAAHNGHAQCVEFLAPVSPLHAIKGGAHFGRNPLHHAARSNSLESVQILSQLIDPNQVDDNGRDALTLACKHGQTKIAQFLLNRAEYPSPGSASFDAFFEAAGNGHPDCIRALLDAGWNPDRRFDCFGVEETPLWVAVDRNWPDCVKLIAPLVPLSGQPLQKNLTLLEAAAKGERWDIVEELAPFARPADIETLLHDAPKSQIPFSCAVMEKRALEREMRVAALAAASDEKSAKSENNPQSPADPRSQPASEASSAPATPGQWPSPASPNRRRL